mmetsp:Transcript_11137/g.24889  ORF Transcript_11137/g.24889 Transcript_11137/m.24889 type:complete len:225 (+) Transcript_11137:573-1247(+)
MATTPLNVQRSAQPMPGLAALTGSSHLMALSRPAFPPCASSSLKRMVPPSEPPVLVILSYVPDECHARRTKVGPLLGSALMSFSRSPRACARTAGVTFSSAEASVGPEKTLATPLAPARPSTSRPRRPPSTSASAGAAARRSRAVRRRRMPAPVTSSKAPVARVAVAPRRAAELPSAKTAGAVYSAGSARPAGEARPPGQAKHAAEGTSDPASAMATRRRNKCR